MNRIHLLLVISIVFLPHTTRADDEQCIQGQHILTVSSVDAVKDREIKNADALLPEHLTVEEEIPSAVLIDDGSSAWNPELGEMKTEEKETAQNLCRRMKKEFRREKEKARKSGKIVRLPDTCSCNSHLQLKATPNDSLFTSLWGLNQSQNDIDIDAPEAWNMTTGNRETVVAIIDTGVDYTHSDLAANMWRNPGEISGNGIDDDRNGYIDDVHGINAIYDVRDRRSGNPMDDHSHGTHVAGTIGAVGNNNRGVVGVNWNVSMIGAKFLSSTGSGSLFDALECLNYLSNLKQNFGVNIVVANNSWGGGGFDPALEAAIRRMRDLGIVFVAAAGNENNNNDASPSYPANYQVSNVVSVAAIDANGNRANFSNYGANTVHIAAPGVNISSTIIGNTYGSMSGTSMAAPHVSGAIALLSSYRPQTSAVGLINTILNSAVRISSLNGLVQSQRSLNVYNALLNAPLPPPTATPAPPTPTPIPTATRTPVATATATPTPTQGPLVATIQGRVVTSTGGAVANVQVRVRNIQTGVELIRTTGSDGAYSLPGLATRNDYTVTVSKSGESFMPAQYPLRLIGDTSINFVATSQAYQLKVQVVSRTKRPLSGVLVHTRGLGSAVTNNNGEVTFPIGFGTPYSITVDSENAPMTSFEANGVAYGDVGRVFVSYIE